MSSRGVVCDERTRAVENASYRVAYLVLTYGLLVAVAYRGLVLGQASWDLLALVVAGGAITVGYQAFHRTVSRRMLLVGGASALLAAAVAMLLARTLFAG